MAIPTNEPVENGVTAKDYRRGLFAFRILGYRIDSARPYAYLTNSIIQIVDPSQINLDEIPAVDSGWAALFPSSARAEPSTR